MTTKPKTRKAPAKPDRRRVCTEKEAAALSFEPWKKGDETVQFPTLEEINNPYLISCRAAYALMFKSKPEMIEMFKRANDAGDEKTLHLMFDNFERARKFFNGMVTLLDGALSRMVVAGSSYVKQQHDRRV
jgi:hypothetical protein